MAGRPHNGGMHRTRTSKRRTLDTYRVRAVFNGGQVVATGKTLAQAQSVARAWRGQYGVLGATRIERETARH